MFVLILTAFWIVIGNSVCRLIFKRNPRKVYCVITTIILAFIMGFRGKYIGGTDTSVSYIPVFEKICSQSLTQVFSQHQSKDVFFYLVTKMFSYISHDYHLYFLTIALFVVGSMSRVIYKYSENIVLSYVIYFSLGYFSAGFQLLRLVIAISILLFAYKYLMKRKLIPFLIIIAIASLFHATAIIFIIAYPIASIKIGFKQWIFVMCGVILAFLGKVSIFRILSVILPAEERYSTYLSGTYASSLSITGFLILLAIYVTSYFLAYGSDLSDSKIKTYFNLGSLSVAFMALVGSLGEFQRVSMYFGMYNTLLLPYCLNNTTRFTKESKLILKLLIPTVILLYFFVFAVNGNMLNEYVFFWQE